MHSSQFVGYVGPSDLHDGQIREVQHDQGRVTIRVEGDAGRSISLVFMGVTEIRASEPVGMVLYALCELSAPAPCRRFVFVNWAADDPARLEIVAEGLETVG